MESRRGEANGVAAIRLLALCVCVLLAVSCGVGAACGVRRTVGVTGPTGILFLPPALLAAAGEGANEALADVDFAVEDAVKALLVVSSHGPST